MPPAQGISDAVGRGVSEEGKDERLHVPEGVAVVARTGQPLRGDRTLLGTCGRLQDVKHREADALLDLVVALELHV